MIKIWQCLLLTGLVVTQNAWAKETRYLGRSPTGLLMGDAYTALADDAYTLFYNPAALSRNRGISFSLINPMIGVTNPGVSYNNPTGDIDKFSNVDTSSPTAIAAEFVDYPVYIGMGITPTLKFGPFGLTGFTNFSNSLVLKNAIHPIADIKYSHDNGFIFGYAQRFGPAATGRSGLLSIGQGHLFAVGGAIKYMQRESIHAQYDLFGPKLLGQITGGNISSISDVKNVLGHGIGTGTGFDFGAEHSYIKGRSIWTNGFSILDLGGTLFRKSEGEGEVERQEMLMSFGTAFSQNFYIFDYRLALDLHPLNDPTLPTMSKLHFGIDMGIPGIRLMTGFNAGYLSYGLKFNLWPIQLLIGLYGIETGYEYKQREAKRAVIYLSLLDFSIDA